MPDLKTMLTDLMSEAGANEEQLSSINDDFVGKVDSFYKGDYRAMIKDLYQEIGGKDISGDLTDEFMSGVEQYYGLKKKSQASPSVRAATEPLQAFQTGLEGRTPEQQEEAKEAVRGISPLAYAEPIPYDVAATISDLKSQLEPSWKNLSKAYADKYAEEKANSIKNSSGLLSFANAMGMFSGDVMVGGDQFVPSAELAQLEKQVKNAGTAYKLLKDAEKWLSEPAVDKAGKTTWVGRFVDGIGNADWADILTMGATGLEYSLNVASIASKANEGGVDSLDEDEYSALVAYGLLQQARSGDKSIAYQGGRMVAEMIPFIIQFAYTGGIAEGGKQVAKQALKGMGKLGEKAITKALVKAGVTVGTGAIRSTLGVSAPAAVAERMAGQVSLSTNEAGKTVIDRIDVEPVGEAAVKGLASNAAEFIFEDAGKALGFIGKTKVGRWMGGIVPDSKVVDRISSTIGYNGFIGEVVEELGTAYAQAGITGDKPVSQAVGKDDLMLILVGTASMAGTINAMKYGAAGAQAMSNSLRRRSEGLRPDLMERVNSIVDGDPEAVATGLQTLVDTEVASKDELEQLVSYASAKLVDVSAEESAGLGAGQDVLKDGTPTSKKSAIEVIRDNNKEIDTILSKDIVSNQDLITAQEIEEENSRLTSSLEAEVDDRFGEDARVEEIRAELDALYTGDVSGAALMEQAEKEQGLRNELAGLLKEKRAIRESLLGEYEAVLSPKMGEPIQTITTEEKVAQEAPIDVTEPITEQIDAEETGKEVEVAGQEEGLKGQEGEPVRVREPKKDRVEAKKGEALAVTATEEEDVESFSMEEVVPEFTSTYTEQIDKLKNKLVQHEEVKSTLQEFVKSKRKEIDKADSRRGRYVSELIASATPRTLGRRMASIERILSNDAYAKKVMDTSAKLKKLQAKVKGAKADYDVIKDVALKAKVTRKGQNLSAFINGIDASELPEAMLDDLSTLVDDLSKRVPDARNLKSFVNAYKGVLQNAADMAMVSNAADAKDAKAVERRVGKIKDKLDELTSVEVGQLDVSQIRSLKREATALASALDNMVKNGDISVTEDGVDIVNETLSPIADILNNDVNALGAEVSEAIAKAEQQYKKETGKRILSKDVSGKAITEEDGKMLSELYNALKQVVSNDRALGMLSSYDIDIIEQAVTQVDEAGLVPTKLYQITNKVKAANRYRLAQDGVFDLLEAEEGLSKAAEAFLKKTPKGKEEKLGLVSDITTGQVVGIAKRIRGVMNNPIYNYITNVGSQAIIRSEGLVKDVMTPVFNAVNKGRRTGVGGAIKTYVYDTGVSRGDLKPYDRVGILMNQLQFVSNLKSPKGRVVAQANGTFTVVDANGEPIKEDKKTKKFTSAADAIDFLSTLEPEMLTNGRALDYFDIVNYDYVDGERVSSQSRRDAKLSKKDMVNDNELAHFDDAYAQLVDRLRKQKNDNTITDLSSVRTEEDVKALMDAHELEVYNEIRNAFDSLYDKASAVAARDGKVLDKVDFYFTMMNKSSRFDKVENTGAMIDGIFNAFGKGKMPQLTGSIQERSNMIHYVDFNALRVLESYVRDMAVSYEVMPAIAEQMEALKMVMNEYSKGIGKASILQKKQRMQQVKEVAEALRENVRSGYVIEYNRQKLIGDVKLPIGNKKYVDVSRILSHVSNNVKNVVLNKAGRIPLDVIPNSVKLGIDALRFKNPQEKANWLTFFTHNRGSIPSLKVDEMVNKYSMGGYEGFVQKGAAQALADSWSGIGDNMTVFNAWTSKFPTLYKQLSGREFDLERYISDEAYRGELNASDAFQQAKSMADGYVEEHTVPQTQYANRKAMNAWITRLKPTDKMFKLFQPMSVYTAKDAEAFYANMTDAIMNTNAGRTDAMGRVARIVVSNLAFNAMSQLFFGLNTYLAGAMNDDELLKEVAKDRMNVFAPEDIGANAGSTIISLLLGKQMNLGRILMSAMYNVGKTGYVYWHDNKAIANRRLKDVKSIEGGSGIGKALMPIDLTSENIPVETAANILLPFYGQQFVKYGASVKNMAEEMYNASLYLAGEKEARTLDEQNMWSTINSANMLLFSLVNPASSDVRQISDMMMKEYEEYGISKEVLMASLYADDFILTNSDVNERYDAMYERAIKANIRKGMSQEEAETMARKRAEAVVDVFRGEYDGDNGKRMDFYMLNKASIDMFRKAINVVSKSRMGKAEREKWYKVINESYADMYDKYEQYAAGKDVAYTVPDSIIELMAGKTVDDTMVRIYKSVYMLERMGK